jgi:murein DD-endopeptidase MepM/ murein hydrolase activator NlpD
VKSVGKVLVQISFVAIACLCIYCTDPQEHPAESIVKIEPDVFTPNVQYNMLVNDLIIEHYKVKPKQQFSDLLHGYKISQAAWVQLNSLTKKEFDFRKVVAGNPYLLLIRPDSVCSLQSLIYHLTSSEYVVFHFNDSLRLDYCQKEISLSERTVTGTIENNLSEAISSQGISHELTNRMVDILGWQIDFYHLQKADHFKIIYQEKSIDNKPIGIGRILGICFNHANKVFWAVPFDQGDGLDYFDLSGNSIRRAFLRYPIEFTHISSRYSMNRFHPVLKVNRPHLGTDLAAATGTPIRSVGGGVVAEAGYNAGSGNYVKVRHNNTYTTGYLHMSKIGSGIRKGVTVNQAQVIGYVGSTGWATGPHLCYRFWKNGVQVDALRVVIPPAKPIKKESANNFECALREALGRLEFQPNLLQHALASN